VSGPTRNWAGNITFNAARVHRPSSVPELQELVAGSDRLRALGTGHSFNRIADTSGDLVSLAGLPDSVRIDPEAATVTVSGGLRYGDFVARLHEQGYALRNLASLPHINVVGACVTATHGSGERNGNLATAVSGMELVLADGERATLTRDADGDVFRGAVVGLGALGVITSLTLDVVPTYDVRQHVYDDLALDQLAEHFDEIEAAAYSVSLFTNWRTSRVNNVWLKQRADEPIPPRTWLGATLADGPRHPISGMPGTNCTEQLGVPGPWHARLPHFRLEFTPSRGDELQSEYVVERRHGLDAFAALDRIRGQIAPVLQTCEIRTTAADDLWMSYNFHRDSAAFHFTWAPDAAAVTPVVAAIEERLAPFEPRPHWGKIFLAGPEVISQRYERWDDFRGLLVRFDPAGKFRNGFIDRHFPRPAI
jgi:alditol oxidase